MRTAIMLAAVIILGAIRPSALADGSWPIHWQILIPCWIGFCIVADMMDFLRTLKVKS